MQPEQLGRYRIISELGRGAMGLVFLAHDPEIDRRIAIKTVQIFASLPERERGEARERFLREARSAGKLLHPGIVTLFDAGEAEGALYLAMEYVEGTTLDDYCRADNLLPAAQAAEMVAQAAEALEYAHTAGIIHRDIKSANLMRVGEQAVKIMDFGLAKPPEGDLTRNGELLGTPSYMSPEQIRGERIDGRSDLFSLAVVLYEMLTGEKPFPGETVSSIIYRIVNEEPAEIGELGGRVSPRMAVFLNRALAKSPDDRFFSGAEFAESLRTAAASGEEGVAPLEQESVAGSDLPAPERTRPRRSSITPFVLGIVILVAALAGTAYVFRERLGWFEAAEPLEIWLEASVRAEPAEARLFLNGEPLEPEAAGLLRFRADAPPALLAAELECRRVERELSAADGSTEVVLVLDSLELSWPLDTGEAAASVSLNGAEPAATPLDLQLDLCRDNRLELEADGFYPASVEIPTGATPLEARKILGTIELQEIPKGLMVLSESATRLDYRVDGRRVEPGEIELPEGRHELRLTNEGYWIDVTIAVDVAGGERVVPELRIPALTTLTVQAFPANCKVHLRRPGGGWKYFDDTPVSRRIAVGRYDVRVTLNPTGERRERSIELAPGSNPPVRVAFGRDE
jgi:hypothetical protein